MAEKKCPLCGRASLLKKNGEYRFEPPANVPGGAIVVAEAEWLHCASCEEDILSGQLEAAIEVERRRRLGMLTPGEMNGVREKMGLSQQEMSHLLGVEESTYARWECGRSLPTRSGDALIRKMAAAPEMFVTRATDAPQ